MDMVKVKGAYKLKKIYILIVLIMMAGLRLNVDERYFEFNIIALLLFDAVFTLGFLGLIILGLVSMEVHYDRERLIIKHMLYKKEISMEDISSVSYSFKGKKTGYDLVLKIKHKGGKFFMTESIRRSEYENCKKRTINKPILTLYNFIEAEYPEKAKGYIEKNGF